MAEPRFADDDDLPRTLRRERDARERELREREREMAAPAADEAGFVGGPGKGFSSQTFGYDYAPAASTDGAVTVTRLNIPFLHLVVFFLKAAIAAIPALLLLTVLMWIGGQGLKLAFPELRHFEIVVKSVR